MRTILATMLCLGAAAPVAADIAPPRGARERAFAEQIRQTGRRCAEPLTYAAASGPRAEALDKRGLVATRVVCAGGEVYLVGNPPRRRGPPAPDAPSRPEPTVEPWR
jgi:hypothetical protein